VVPRCSDFSGFAFYIRRFAKQRVQLEFEESAVEEALREWCQESGIQLQET
jgi:hypothetical protein